MEIGIYVAIGIALLWVALRLFSGNKVYDNKVLRDKGYTWRTNLINGESEKYNGAKSVWYDKNGEVFYGKDLE